MINSLSLCLTTTQWPFSGPHFVTAFFISDFYLCLCESMGADLTLTSKFNLTDNRSHRDKLYKLFHVLIWLNLTFSYNLTMTISPERIREIERATVGQAQNPLWHEYRKNRITASHFGRALTAYASLREYRSTDKLDEMRHGMVTSANFTNPAIEWGTKHEATAVAEYVKHSGNKVIPSGIWLFPDGDLAASPDWDCSGRKRCEQVSWTPRNQVPIQVFERTYSIWCRLAKVPSVLG